ncbi:MAG TPA: hypothetical protein VFR34_04185, partial [Paracoccaceae bacterium]|nr:hypothetical protein [Paracoccaceae bacterium]
ADLGRWQETAKSRPGWDARNIDMSRFVRSGEVVFDFGAGARTVREMVPENCRYCPIDCVASDPSVYVVDFNCSFGLPDPKPTCLYMSGFLEYLDDLPGFVERLRRAAPDTFAVFSYGWEIREPERRAQAGWRNDLGGLAAATAFFSSHFNHLRQVSSHGKPGARQAIFTGVTRPFG